MLKILENYKGGIRKIFHWILQEIRESNLVIQYHQNENILFWNYMSGVVWFQRLGFKITSIYNTVDVFKLTMANIWEAMFVTVAVKLCSFFVFHESKVQK